MRVNTLVIFQDEVMQRTILDWVVSHISGVLPPHRYKGELEILGNAIRFVGTDTKLDLGYELLISKDSIESVYYGYDDIYNVYQTRGLGLTWAPVRIKFTDSDKQIKVAYFITGYDRWNSTNGDFYSFLTEWLS